MVARVEQMLALHRRRTAARTPHEQSVLQAQIDATVQGRQFDKLVYKLKAPPPRLLATKSASG